MNIAILAISTLIVLIVFGIPVATHPQWFKSVEEEIEEAKREGHIVTAKPVKIEHISKNRRDDIEEPHRYIVTYEYEYNGKTYVHIEFNTKDHTPSPIMAALSFLFSKEMLYVKYASNDIAAYEDPLMLRKCGFYRCKAGHFTEGFGLRGYEAAEEACRMWGYTLSDYVSEGVVNGKYRVFWRKHKA